MKHNVTAEAVIPRNPLIILCAPEHADVLEAVKSGATGYLLKSASTEELVDAVRRTALGETVFTPEPNAWNRLLMNETTLPC